MSYEATKPGLVWFLLGLVFGFLCISLSVLCRLILVVVGLFYQYHSQVIGWKDLRLRNDLLCVEWDVKLY